MYGHAKIIHYPKRITPCRRKTWSYVAHCAEGYWILLINKYDGLDKKMDI